MRQRLALLVLLEYDDKLMNPEDVIKEVRTSMGFGKPMVILLRPSQVLEFAARRPSGTR